MKTLPLLVLLTGVLTLLFGCGGSASKPGTSDSDSIDSTVHDTLAPPPPADTTIYAKCVGAGHAGMEMLTQDGSDLELTLAEGLDGMPGSLLYGDTEEESRYAFTLRPDGENIDRLINITQLERFTKDYKICNAQLLLPAESDEDHAQRHETLSGSRAVSPRYQPVVIEELSDTRLRCIAPGGHRYEFRR